MDLSKEIAELYNDTSGKLIFFLKHNHMMNKLNITSIRLWMNMDMMKR